MGPGRVEVSPEYQARVSEYLGRRGNSIASLARAAGVAYPTVRRCIAGKKLDAKTYARIAKAIGYGAADQPAGVAPAALKEIHVAIQPGARLTIIIDDTGVTVTRSPES